MKKIIVLSAAACVLAAAHTVVMSAPGGGWEPSESSRSSGGETEREGRARALYDEGTAAVEAEDYEKALRLFKKSGRIERQNPDTLNMTAFCLRKLGRVEEAFEFYQKALRLRSEFPQAREYLAEAHLDMAAEQIKLLKGYGGKGERELKKLREAVERLRSELDAE